jgi:lysophospholipase L1-like esterase
MKAILAYGDSLTWGADPVTKDRHPFAARWPTVLETGLQGRARVMAEGLPGRTTCFDDHAAPNDRNGAATLPGTLATHAPLDLVIIMLGTNDLKPHLGRVAQGSASGMKRLIQIVRHYPYSNGGIPQVLVIAPPPRVLTGAKGDEQHDQIRESQATAALYRALAAAEGAGFFDAGTVAQASPADGAHLDAVQTTAIGHALTPLVAAILDLQLI